MKPKVKNSARQKSKPKVLQIQEDPFSLKSIAELQVSIEQEINMVKTDQLRPDQARNISVQRRNQYRGIELALQHKRLALMSGNIRTRAAVLPLPVAAGQ